MQIRCEIKENGDIQVACCCLKTDTWLDYISFKQDAREAFARQDVKAYARFLRAALLSLFGHLEAVVNETCDKIKRPALKDKSLCQRMNVLANEVRSIAHVSPIVFQAEKNLRDMIAHPGIEKSFDVSGGNSEDYGATYERLDFQALERVEALISPWIDAICAAFVVTRLEDTKGAMKEFTDELSKLTGSPARVAMPEGGPSS